ncbi:hypothetical protein FQZ97_897660 [compost metagenome]
MDHVFIGELQVQVLAEMRLVHHQVDGRPDRVGCHRQLVVVAQLEHRQGVLMIEGGTTQQGHGIGRVCLLHLVDELVQGGRQASIGGEHLQLLGSGQAVEYGEVLVATDVIAEQRQSAVQRFIVPVPRIDQHAVHVGHYSLDGHDSVPLK